MLGSVFVAFSELVEENYGLVMWDTLLQEVQPASKGAYTTGLKYDDAELFALVGCLSEKTGVEIPDLVRVFGEYLFTPLYNGIRDTLECKDLRSFLLDIDEVIHVDVLRLYPEAMLPSFTYDNSQPDRLIMNYRSSRKLCVLSEGLLTGASKTFNEPIRIEHPVCMHQGADHCELVIHFL